MFSCNFCLESFNTKSNLITHQNKSKICQRYRRILFTCQNCGFKTNNGLKDIDKHIINCNHNMHNTETPDNVNSDIAKLKEEKDNLLKLLSIERAKCSIFIHLLEKNTNINISNYVTTENDVVNFYNQTNLDININNDLTITNKQTEKKANYRHINCLPIEPEKELIIDNKTTIKDETTDVLKETKEYIDNQYEKLKDNRNYSKILDDIKQKRKLFLDKYNYTEYTEVLNNHISKLKEMFENKKYNNKKIETIIFKSLYPLESRLVSYSTYFDSFIDMDEIENVKNLVENSINDVSEFIPYIESNIYNYICNYSLSLLPVLSLFRMILCKNKVFSNIIYVSLPKSSNEDPYSFYRLDSINNNNKRQWKLDWRLEDLSLSLSTNLLNFMITMFRKIYKDIFLDNDYRENYISYSQITSCDLEQLVQNIITVTNRKQFCINLQTIIIENCTYTQMENDKFNLIGDDTLQKKNFHELENKGDEDIFTLLFDNVSEEKSKILYKNRIT